MSQASSERSDKHGAMSPHRHGTVRKTPLPQARPKNPPDTGNWRPLPPPPPVAAPPPPPVAAPPPPPPPQARLKSDWFSMFVKLQFFKQVHGHTIVTSFNCPDRELVHWTSQQRLSRKKLSPERAVLLSQLGLQWREEEEESTASEWERMFAKVVEFKALHGHAYVPRAYKPHNLGPWLYDQCRKEMTGILSPRHVQLLQLIGVDFEDFWEQGLSLLSTYRSQHGSYPSSKNAPELKENNPELFDWIECQAEAFANGSFSARRRKILDKIGFVFHRGKDPAEHMRPVKDTRHRDRAVASKRHSPPSRAIDKDDKDAKIWK